MALFLHGGAKYKDTLVISPGEKTQIENESVQSTLFLHFTSIFCLVKWQANVQWQQQQI